MVADDEEEEDEDEDEDEDADLGFPSLCGKYAHK
jgi:hypothetical protein